MTTVTDAREMGEKPLTARLENLDYEQAPGFDSMEALGAFLDAIAGQDHDYNTSCTALVYAATTAFRTMSRLLGSSGAQAELAALSAYASVVAIDGPFAVMRAEELVYDGNRLTDQLAELEAKWSTWLAEQGRQKLAEQSDREGAGHRVPVHPRVLERWRELAGGEDGD